MAAVPFAVLVLGVTLTGAVVVNFATRESEVAAAAFKADTLAVQRLVQVQFDTVVGVTHAAAALLAASPEINFVEFRAFVSGLQLHDRYPGLQGIGFAPRVARTQLREFVRSVALDGIQRLTVRPEGARAEYYPAVMLDPPDDNNKSVVGFDMVSSPELRLAMERARDTNGPALTELVETSTMFGSQQRELILYLPVYRRGAPIVTVAQRRNALVGYVFSRLDPETMLRDTVAAAASRSLAVAIYDRTGSRDAVIVSSGDPRALLRSTAGVSVGGRDWVVVANSRDAEIGGLPPEARRTLITGVLLTLLLFALMRVQVRAWRTAEAHATELQRVDSAKDEFLAVLSHELRTPLNAMLGWLSMLRSGSVSEERRSHALDIVERNARAQAQLIEDLLEVSRILMGKMRIEKRPVSVVPAIAAVIESLRPTALAKGVKLNDVELGSDQNFVIAADAGRFAQIITNLVSNGIKFTPAGGAVWVNVDSMADSVKISVRDTGIGISDDFLPHVFDRFRQADTSTTRTHNGLGMGLAIVRDLVGLHGGTIQAYSKGPQQGALFVITIPLIAESGDGHDNAELALAVN
jgi:signal transduction histidine kinase